MNFRTELPVPRLSQFQNRIYTFRHVRNLGIEYDPPRVHEYWNTIAPLTDFLNLKTELIPPPRLSWISKQNKYFQTCEKFYNRIWPSHVPLNFRNELPPPPTFSISVENRTFPRLFQYEKFWIIIGPFMTLRISERNCPSPDFFNLCTPEKFWIIIGPSQTSRISEENMTFPCSTEFQKGIALPGEVIIILSLTQK